MKSLFKNKLEACSFIVHFIIYKSNQHTPQKMLNCPLNEFQNSMLHIFTNACAVYKTSQQKCILRDKLQPTWGRKHCSPHTAGNLTIVRESNLYSYFSSVFLYICLVRKSLRFCFICLITA